MTPRSVRLCLAVFLTVGAFSARAQPVAPPAAGADEMVSEIKLPDGNIDDALSLLKELTGRYIIRPAQLQTPPPASA